MTGTVASAVPAGDGPAVEVRDLRIGATRRGRAAGDDEIVHGVSFTIEAGRCVALVGESGAGKSITARALLGLSGDGTAVTAQTLRVLGDDVLGYSAAQWRRLRGGRAGLILQDALTSLDPLQTVHSAISEVLRQHGTVPRSRVDARVVELLELVGIADAAERSRQRPGQLSGGLRQRALIATAIAADPGLIVADEPTTALDVTVQQQVLDLLGAIRAADGVALVLISHDVTVVGEVCDRVLVMYAGRVVEEVTAAGLATRAQHPYTRALVAAVPDMDTDVDAPLATIAGRPVDPADVPPGCPYAARCPLADDRCRAEDPPLAASPTGRVACWRAGEPLTLGPTRTDDLVETT